MYPDKQDSLKCQVSSVKRSNSELRTSHSPSSGFTFIELLATVVLIAVIMPVAMRSIGLCTQLAGQSRRQVEAASLAKAKLTELIVTGDWEKGNKKGDFEKDWPGYEWSITVSNWTDALVRQLELTVSWRSMGRPRTVTLSTLVYPEES